MSVPVGKRSLSELEFFKVAMQLRKELTFVLLRNFGVKDRVRSLDVVSRMHKMSPEDSIALGNILNKYKLGESLLDQYPQWLLDHFRSTILIILRDLIKHISSANSIYPTSIQEYNERRYQQNCAITCAENLLHELNYLISILPSDANKLLSYVELADKESKLLRGWRKSDNRILKRIKG